LEERQPLRLQMAGNDPQDQPKHWAGLVELNFFAESHYPELPPVYSSRNARIYTDINIRES